MSYSESALSTHGCLYTFSFLYAVTNVLVFLQGAYHEAGRHEDFQRYATAMARGAGGLINLNSAIVLLLASRSALGFLRATPLHLVLPIDKAMPEMHRVVGSIILLASIVHVVHHIPVYAKKDVWSPGLSGFTSLFITGLLLSGSMLIIYFVARPTVLHESYELFHRTHIGGAVVYYALLVIHGNHRSSPSTWKFIIGPVLIYVCDVAFRSLREKKSYLLLLKHSAACQGPHIVKIRLPRVFHYQAGQYAEIKVPTLSRFQWHPFTIASAPHEPEIIFYIKAVGDWTKSLYKLFEDRTVLNDDFRDDIEIHIRGPYGAPAQHVGQFDRVILIGGGVGATPFCSVVKDAYYWIKNWIPRQHQRPSVRNNNNTRPADNNENNRNDREQQRDEGHIRLDNPDEHVINMDHDVEGEVAQVPRADQGPTGSSSTPENESHESRTWGLLTTNVISEAITTEQSIPADDLEETTAIQFPDREVTGMQPRHSRSEQVIGDGSSNSNADGTEQSTMYTARGMTEVFGSRHDQWPSDWVGTYNGQSGERREDTEQQIANIEAGDAIDAITAIETDHSIQNVSTMAMRDRRQHGRKRRGIRRASFDEVDIHAIDRNWMGSYYGNSSSSHRHSLDYVTALQSVAYSERADAVFQKSLDMMIGMSFGSVSLMRTMQYKRTQQNIRQGRTSTAEVGVEMFRSPRVMFLLYMRSVTMNMLIVWLLIIRFTIAGAAYAFDELQLFSDGVQLYDIPALNATDLAICLILVLLFSLPTLVEALEIGAAFLHGLELFVLTPIAIFDAVIDVFALRGLARNVDKMFNLFHVFLIWPMLTILMAIRLLRVIGERITQVQTMQASHATTRAVDFFWTAPTGDDDLWLVGELAKYSDMKELRLHRYLTREEPPPPPPPPPTQHALPLSPLDWNQGQSQGVNRDISRGREREGGRRGVQQEEDMHKDGMGSMVTNHGRPNWSEIFNSVAERSLNNTTIGVFFCGPMSMSRAIQEASMEAMRNSIVRGLQSGVQAMRGLEEIFGDAITANQYTGDVDKSSTASKNRIGHNGRGCNITIVFKRESFS